MSQSSEKSTSKRQRTVVIFLLFAVIALASVFFWSLQRKNHFKKVAQNASVKVDSIRQKFHRTDTLTSIDDLVFREKNYDKALEEYSALLSSMPENKREQIRWRIEWIKTTSKAENRTKVVQQKLIKEKDGQINKLEDSLATMQEKKSKVINSIQTNNENLTNELAKIETQLKKVRKELNQKENIQVLTFKSSKGNKVHYLGEVHNEKAQGGGIGIWSTGSIYKGEWKNNKRHGEGVFEWSDGERYEGEYVEGRREGEGTYFWPGGERYEGEWENDQRNGEGTLYNENGNISYKGQWRNDMPVND